jgi:hypothetical protein
MSNTTSIGRSLAESLKGKRILIAPHEIGGQMQLMAEEMRRRGLFATAACDHQEFRGYVNDIQLNSRGKKGRLRQHWAELLFANWAANNYDIFHFFWGRSLFGFDIAPHLDLPVLKQRGKRILVHFRGSDVVDIAYYDYLHARAEGRNVPEPPLSRSDQLRSLAHWRKYADRMLVSTPPLLDIVPEAILVPQAIDVDYWAPASTETAEGRSIRIVHAPTRRNAKGTEFLVAAVDRLHGRGGQVELVLVEEIPAGRVRELYESCDIAVDQLLYGWHGKFSVELMSMGKPVVCYINPRFGRNRPDLPIVSAGPRELEQALKELVEDPGRRRELGDAGRAYACKYHDVRVVVDQCLDIYADASGTASGR